MVSSKTVKIVRPFTKIESDDSRRPHRFAAYRYETKCPETWNSLVDGCLEAWRLKAKLFYDAINETGFRPLSGKGVHRVLNEHGRNQLPQTPAEDESVTKNPAITDLTEVLAIEFFRLKIKDLVFPYPRVFHRELPTGSQHRGIDLLGYRQSQSGFELYVIEVMASCQNVCPPKTVSDHKKQLLDNTLDSPGSNRLLKDLQTLHAESDESHRDVIIGFMDALLAGRLSQKRCTVATSVLIRKVNCFKSGDWRPFLDATEHFEKAHIPSKVLFIAIESYDTFSGLLDLVKSSACNAACSEEEV